MLVETVDEQADAAPRLRIALGFGAFLWLFLLLVDFVAPGDWHWGRQGVIGHMINDMIAFWFVALVAAPLLAMRDPLHSTTVIQRYVLGMVGVMLSSMRSEHPEFLSDGVPLSVALLAIGVVLRVHPHRARLWRLA